MMTQNSSEQQKAENANVRAYTWAIITYPHLKLPYLPILPNKRLRRTIACIYVSPIKQRHIEYAPDYFNATNFDYCIKVLKHEYTHLVCYLKDPKHYRDGDPIFENELAKHHLENNYNSNNRDKKASSAIQTVIQTKQIDKQNRQRQQRQHRHQKETDILNGGKGIAVVCGYCGNIIKIWKNPSLTTVFKNLARAECRHCHCTFSRCYLLQIIQPTSLLIIRNWVKHLPLTVTERATFAVAELLVDKEQLSMIISRMTKPDIFNYCNLNFATSRTVKAHSATRLSTDSNYQHTVYPKGRGW